MKHAFSFLYRSEVEMETKKKAFFSNNKNKGDVSRCDKERDSKKDGRDKSKQQKEFDVNRDLEEKKPFDKKTYRLKKYSKKYKLQQWEEKRKQRLMREYQKEVKKESMAGTYKPKLFDEDTIDSSNTGRFVKHPDLIEKENLQTKKDPFQKAKEEYKKVKQSKLEKKQEFEKIKEEKKQKLEEYKRKKQERFKKLSKKTKKGQPVMTGRLELLLEKIQEKK